MPRIHDANREPLDYCNRCYYSIELDAFQGGANDVDTEHPDYADTDYKCEICGKVLTSADN